MENGPKDEKSTCERILKGMSASSLMNSRIWEKNMKKIDCDKQELSGAILLLFFGSLKALNIIETACCKAKREIF